MDRLLLASAPEPRLCDVEYEGDVGDAGKNAGMLLSEL